MNNPFKEDPNHYGPITVRQLVELMSDKTEFPKGLDTEIKIGDVEGNNPTAGNVVLTWHRPGDIVLSIDPHSGDREYEAEGDVE